MLRRGGGHNSARERRHGLLNHQRPVHKAYTSMQSLDAVAPEVNGMAHLFLNVCLTRSSGVRFAKVFRAVDEAWQLMAEALGGVHGEEAMTLRSHFAASTFSDVPPVFVSNIETFLRAYLHGARETSARPVRLRKCQVSLSLFWRQVRDLGWFIYFREPLHTTLYAGIHKFVYYACNSCYELPTLAKSNQWKREVLLPWVLALGTGPLVSAQISHEIASLCGSIDLVLDEVYVDARISEIYDIITEFPESGCAVHELRGALTRTRYHYRIARTVRATLQRRILHPGANTSQIIDVYISTVKVLRILDPTNAILDAATRPVRKYLLRRKDTVRCIVASLTDEASGELFEELHQTDAPPLENYNDSDDEENGNGIFSLPAEQSEVASEVLPMLVSIYGSKDIFVSEYRLMLAKKCVLRFIDCAQRSLLA